MGGWLCGVPPPEDGEGGFALEREVDAEGALLVAFSMRPGYHFQKYEPANQGWSQKTRKKAS